MNFSTTKNKMLADARELADCDALPLRLKLQAQSLFHDLRMIAAGTSPAYVEADLLMPDGSRNPNWFRVRPNIGDKLRLNNGTEYRVSDICHVAGPLEVFVREIGATTDNDSRERERVKREEADRAANMRQEAENRR